MNLFFGGSWVSRTCVSDGKYLQPVYNDHVILPRLSISDAPPSSCPFSEELCTYILSMAYVNRLTVGQPRMPPCQRQSPNHAVSAMATPLDPESERPEIIFHAGLLHSHQSCREHYGSVAQSGSHTPLRHNRNCRDRLPPIVMTDLVDVALAARQSCLPSCL